jgi:phosphonate transport system substrate-binding protein
MSIETPHEIKKFPLWGAIVIILLLAAVVTGVIWSVSVRKTIQEGEDTYHNVMVGGLGLAHPMHHQLDPKFTDADGDMVADAPTDPKELVDPPKLMFTYIPVGEDTDEQNYRQAFAEFVQHISKVTGKPAEYVSFSSLDDELKAMRDGTLQIAGFNTGAVPIAVNVCGFVPAWKLATASASASYRMQIIVPADSDIHTIEDLKGHELTLTEPGSNSGYKAPMVLLHDQYSMEPGRDYILRYSGSHEDSIKGIADKKYQAAAVASDVLLRSSANGDIKPLQYRVLYESEAFPTACFGYAHNLNSDLVKKISEAFTTFDWKGSGLEKEFSRSEETQFLSANYKDNWALVRKIDDETGVAYKLKD